MTQYCTTNSLVFCMLALTSICSLPLSLQSPMNTKCISGNLPLDSCWLEQRGRPSTADWRFTPSPTTRGSHKSTGRPSFRRGCRRRRGWKGSNSLPSRSMTCQSVTASIATTGTGQDSKYVSQLHVSMKDTLKDYDVFQASHY